MSLKNWNVNAASNNAAPPFGAPEGATLLKDVNDILRAVMADVRTLAASDTIASAPTTDLGSKDATFIDVTGTTAITGLGTVSAGIYKVVTFSDALTLTHNSTSLILPGAANIVTAAGDTAIFLSLGTGYWRCMFYQRKALAPGVATTLTGLTPTIAELNYVDGVTSPIQTQLNALTGPGAVQTPTLLNGWTVSSGWNAPHYWKGADGVVHVHGRVSDGTGLDVFLLPVGYRPPSTITFPMSNQSTKDWTECVVFPSGAVQLRAYTGGSAYAPGGIVSFFAVFRTT